MRDLAYERRKDAIYCAGIVASATLNVWRESGSKPITPQDFLPQERPKNATDEDLIDGVLAVLGESLKVN